jgi:hypothetical protein
LQEAANLDIRWVLMCKAGDLASGLGLSGGSSLERRGSGAGSQHSGASDGGSSVNVADFLGSPTRFPRGAKSTKLHRGRGGSRELGEQVKSLWRNAGGGSAEGGDGGAKSAAESRALDVLTDQINMEDYVTRGAISAPHSRSNSIRADWEHPLSAPHSRSSSLDCGPLVPSSAEASPPHAGISTLSAGSSAPISGLSAPNTRSGTLDTGSSASNTGLSPPDSGPTLPGSRLTSANAEHSGPNLGLSSGYNSSFGTSGSGSVDSSGSLSGSLSGMIPDKELRELPVFDATLEKPLRRQTLVACIKKVAGEVARKEGPDALSPAHWTAAGERYGVLGQAGGEAEAAEGGPKSVHILLVVS